jgi:hypothetical protein
MNRMKAEVYNIKTTLEKFKDGGTEDEESILDMLNALDKLCVPAELIKLAKLGQLVLSIKTKYEIEYPNIASKAKTLLVQWKQTMMSEKTPQQPTAVAQAAAVSGEVTSEKSPARSTSPKPIAAILTTKAATLLPSAATSTRGPASTLSPGSFDKSLLSAARKSVVNIFTSSIKEFSGNRGEEVALAVEAALYAVHPIESAQTLYTTKAKSLSFNLKTHGALTHSILSGVLTTADLLQMSVADMSSQELKEEREKQSVEDSEGRRTDWLEANRLKIQLDNGLDPENTWDYANDENSDNEGDAADV